MRAVELTSSDTDYAVVTSSPLYCSLIQPRNVRQSSSRDGATLRINFSNSRQASPHVSKRSSSGAKPVFGPSTRAFRDARLLLRRLTSSFRFLSEVEEFLKLSMV